MSYNWIGKDAISRGIIGLLEQTEKNKDNHDRGEERDKNNTLEEEKKEGMSSFGRE